MPARISRFARHLRERGRTHFLTGLLVIVPLGITWYVVTAIVKRVDRILAILPATFHPDTYLPFPIPGLGVIFTLIIIWMVGILSANLLGKSFVKSFEGLLGKIPFIRGLHLSIKQFLQQIIAVDSARFRRVVLVRYPGEGNYRIGFVTGERCWLSADGSNKRMLNVFIPNTPNAATGLFFVVSEDEAVTTDLSTDQAFKMVISAGLVAGEQSEYRKTSFK